MNPYLQQIASNTLSQYMNQAYPNSREQNQPKFPSPTAAEYGSLPPGQLPVEASPLVGADTNANNSWMLGGGSGPQQTPIQLGTTNSAAKQAGMSSMMGALAGI